MEPITHFLLGANLGRAGLNRRTALATATLTLAAEAPDIDMLARFDGRVAAFAYHRGFTHSILGGVLVAALVIVLMYCVYRVLQWRNPARFVKLPPRWGLLFAAAYGVVLTHILLDFTNNYGVRAFWPFSERWYSWDIVFIIEPVMLVLLAGGLIVPALGSLIGDEIGARRSGPPGRVAARLALLGIVLLWGVRDYEHRRAVAALDARMYQGAEPLRVSAYPYWVNPFKWYGVVETREFFVRTLVDSLTPEVDPDGGMRIRPKPEETPVTLAAKQTHLGRVYLSWAQFPVTETEELPGGGYRVRFADLRYEYPDRGGTRSLGAAVELDPQLQVLRERFGGEAAARR